MVDTRHHNHHATCHCQIVNLIVNQIPESQSKTDPGHIPHPSSSTRHFFLCPTPPWDLAESIQMIPTMGSGPSFFLLFLDVKFPLWSKTHFTCLLLNNKNTIPRPCYHYPKQRTPLVQLRPDLAHIHAPSTFIAPDTQNLTHSPGREDNTYVTNSQAVTHENRLVRCSLTLQN